MKTQARWNLIPRLGAVRIFLPNGSGTEGARFGPDADQGELAMKRSINMGMLCLVAIIVWTGSVYAQTTNPGAMKTIRLQNGEEVYDVSGEWDVLVENYGEWDHYRTFRQVFKITQEGASFTGIRLRDNPYPAVGSAGSQVAEGEVDKSGIKKLWLRSGNGQIWPSKWQISEDGNRINTDVPDHFRLTWTRK